MPTATSNTVSTSKVDATVTQQHPGAARRDTSTTRATSPPLAGSTALMPAPARYAAVTGASPMRCWGRAAPMGGGGRAPPSPRPPCGGAEQLVRQMQRDGEDEQRDADVRQPRGERL